MISNPHNLPYLGNLFFIPFNTPSSKNSKQWTGKFLVHSKQTQRWQKITKAYWLKYKEEFLQIAKNLPKPYQIEFTFVRQSKHRFDYVNPLQTILDEMVHHEWIIDDNADEVKPYFGNYIYDKKNPGVYIYLITDLKQYLDDLHGKC